jgi:hypothetical protein
MLLFNFYREFATVFYFKSIQFLSSPDLPAGRQVAAGINPEVSGLKLP